MNREVQMNAYRKVVDAARRIRHWHDSGADGMVVSAEHVRLLWEALDALDKLEAAPDWRGIPLAEVNWSLACTESPKVRHLLFRQCRTSPLTGEERWSSMTLGDLADKGDRWWVRSVRYGLGEKGVAAIKRLIDMAAAGLDVCGRECSAYVPQPLFAAEPNPS